MNENLKPYEPNDEEKKLIEALRSGKYQQAKGHLRIDGGYCCLGVACDISKIKGNWDHFGSYFQFSEDSQSSYLPNRVRYELGWQHPNGLTHIERRGSPYYNEGYENCFALDELNDADFTFDQIADIIQAGLVK